MMIMLFSQQIWNLEYNLNPPPKMQLSMDDTPPDWLL